MKSIQLLYIIYVMNIIIKEKVNNIIPRGNNDLWPYKLRDICIVCSR